MLITEFVRAVRANEEGDIEPLKAFKNTRLGLLHEETGQKVEIDFFNTRREVYKAEVPEGVVVLTAGVDVGQYSTAYEIVGWGRGRESWGIEYGLIDGDPREPHIWETLDHMVLNRSFTTFDKKKMRVRKICVDSGYAADFVYSYTKPRQPRCLATKGYGGIGKPLILGAGGYTKGNRARLQLLGVDSGKEEIVNRLTVEKIGPGYCHFPALANSAPIKGYDEEYFKGLCAERRVVKNKHGFPTYIWIKRLSQRNEPFDCRVYALAALTVPSAGIRVDTMQRDIFDEASDKQTAVPFGAQKLSEVEGGVPLHQEQHVGGKFGAQNNGVY